MSDVRCIWSLEDYVKNSKEEVITIAKDIMDNIEISSRQESFKLKGVVRNQRVLIK